MKINSKLNLNLIFKAVYACILILNLVTIYFVATFVNEYVVKTINFSYDSGTIPTVRSTEDINISHFNKVIESLEKKTSD